MRIKVTFSERPDLRAYALVMTALCKAFPDAYAVDPTTVTEINLADETPTQLQLHEAARK
jgi:hypothetical protein